MKPRELCIEAVQNILGAAQDNLIRAEMSFHGMSALQMKAEHGQSGESRMSILSSYKSRVAECKAALKWIKETK